MVRRGIATTDSQPDCAIPIPQAAQIGHEIGERGLLVLHLEGAEHVVEGVLVSGRAVTGIIDAVPQRFVGQRDATVAERSPAGKTGGLRDELIT